MNMRTDLVIFPLTPQMMAVHLGVLVDTPMRDVRSPLLATHLLKLLMIEDQMRGP
jgi:hypothetical protein